MYKKTRRCPVCKKELYAMGGATHIAGRAKMEVYNKVLDGHKNPRNTPHQKFIDESTVVIKRVRKYKW